MNPLSEDERMALFHWKRRYVAKSLATDHNWSVAEASRLAFYRAMFLWKRLGGTNDGEAQP